MPDDEPLTGLERGPLVERFIGEFSSQFFMKDFIYMNVKFMSGNRLKSHPADLLFVLGDECIVVSVKGTDGEPKTDEKLTLWLKKKSWAGSQSSKESSPLAASRRGAEYVRSNVPRSHSARLTSI